MMNAQQAVLFLFLLIAGLSWTTGVVAHGTGAPQVINADSGPYLVSVWTEPDPARVGELHVTVGVAEPETQEVVVDAQVEVALAPLGGETAVVLSALLLFRLRDLISGGIGLWLVNRLLLFSAKSFTLSPNGLSSPGPVSPTLHKHEEEEL